MEEYIITIIAATFGTLGFGMLFKIKPSTLPVCCVGGMLTWCVVLFFDNLNLGIFTSNLIGSIFAILFSSCVAIKIKLPSTILLTTCVVPLVPGGSLYYTMQYLISKDFAMFYEYGLKTILTALGIAGGIVVGSIIFSAIRNPLPKIISINRFHEYYDKKNLLPENNILDSKKQIHFFHLKNDPFQKILSGKKTIELRLYDKKRKQIKIGDFIEFSNIDDNKTITVKVTSICIYPTFKELYENVSLEAIGYDSSNIDTASYLDMNEFYSQEEQKCNYVVAIYFEII
jgi:uncharacterized membrane protein YjjB (DUF3815 family)/ASC-1-like (ASCH) protein